MYLAQNVIGNFVLPNVVAQHQAASTTEGMIATDNMGRIGFFNSAAQRLTGYTLDDVRFQPLASFITFFDESDGRSVKDPIVRSLDSEDAVNLGNHDVMVTRSGDEIPVAGVATPLRDNSSEIIGSMLIFRDVTPTRMLMRRISYEVLDKGKSKLVSRGQFQQRLQHLLDEITILQEHALIILKIKGPGAVDVKPSEDAGGTLLNEITKLILQELREQDTLTQLSDDEFGVLLAHCPKRQALWVAKQLRQSLRSCQFSNEGQSQPLGLRMQTIPISGLSYVHTDANRYLKLC